MSSILWRRLDVPGHDFANLERAGGDFVISGAASFLHEGLPCCLTYTVDCDAPWLTRNARVTGWIGERRVDVTVATDGAHSWTLNGEARDEVRGCIDVDLNFTPATNLLPIRRLNLPIGGKAEVRAAWLRFPSLTLEKLVQTYRRTGERTYQYESDSGFTAELSVDRQGFPTSYGDVWAAETSRT